MTEIEFGFENSKSSIIKVIGVGGAGGNAVNQMFNMNVEGIDFVVCNTDAQDLKSSPVKNKIQIGTTLTEGRGAGNNPDKGEQAAKENLKEIEAVLDDNTKMVFITAGMGGGTGTGAAPVIAEAAKARDILTVGIVSIPFKIEGNSRVEQAKAGIEKMKNNVDALLVINNEKLQELHKEEKFSLAFSKADEILATAAIGIAEIITLHGYINVDFEDVKTVMKNSGVALLGSAKAKGPNRDIEAVKKALESPLLKDNQIRGAKNILLNIISSEEEHELSMSEFKNITRFLQEKAGANTDIIWGTGRTNKLEDSLSVTVIATGFKSYDGLYEEDKKKKIRVSFGDDLDSAYKNSENSDAEETYEIDTDKEGGQKAIELDLDSSSTEEEDEQIEKNDDDENKEHPDKNKNNYLHVKDINRLNQSDYLDELENESALKRKQRNNNNQNN